MNEILEQPVEEQPCSQSWPKIGNRMFTGIGEWLACLALIACGLIGWGWLFFQVLALLRLAGQLGRWQ